MNEEIVEIKEPSVVDKIKAHFVRHKVAYSCGATVVVTAVVTAGITCIVMRRNVAQGGTCVSGAQGGPTNTAPFSFGNKQSIKVTTVVQREGRGHPGYPVRNIETGKVDLSAKAASEYWGIPEGLLSGHLNGKFPDVDGLHFEWVSLTPREDAA